MIPDPNKAEDYVGDRSIANKIIAGAIIGFVILLATSVVIVILIQFVRYLRTVI